MRKEVLFGLVCLIATIGVACSPPDATPAATPAQNTDSQASQTAPTSTSPPTASFSVDVDSDSAPVVVQFNDTSSGETSSVEWDFGDGATSANPAPSHRYTVVGTYTVQLMVTGPGGTDTTQMADLIAVSPGPPFSLEVSPTEITLAVEEAKQFTAVVLDQFSNVVQATPEWAVVAGGGSIGSAGRFTAETRAGSFTDTIRAYVPTASGQLEAAGSVTVEPGPVAEVKLQPSEADLEIGGTQVFTVVVLDEF